LHYVSQRIRKSFFTLGSARNARLVCFCGSWMEERPNRHASAVSCPRKPVSESQSRRKIVGVLGRQCRRRPPRNKPRDKKPSALRERKCRNSQISFSIIEIVGILCNLLLGIQPSELGVDCVPLAIRSPINHSFSHLFPVHQPSFIPPELNYEILHSTPTLYLPAIRNLHPSASSL
jgi:hypothetical protein